MFAIFCLSQAVTLNSVIIKILLRHHTFSQRTFFFTTSEHHYYHLKAVNFEDHDTAAEILKMKTPMASALVWTLHAIL